MIRVKYERYWNDLIRKNEEKSFADLNALADWIFGQMQQDYKKDFAMSFPTPEVAKRIGEKGPWRIEFKPQYGGETFWIHQIEDFNGIIFSDGQFTSRRTHWTTEVQQWLTACDARRRAPKFNFVDEKSAFTEEQWFATTRWAAADVIAAAEERGIAMTEEQAVEWWRRNESRFQNLLVEHGNAILAEMDFNE